MDRTTSSDDDRIFQRAAGYPYPTPAYSYVFARGTVPAPTQDEVLELMHARVPVMAYGSNASPTKLGRVFRDDPDVVIPVRRAWLADFDVVYSSHFARYGALPASLYPSPGTTVTVYLLYVTEEQLLRLHASESLGVNYCFARLTDVRVQVDGGGEFGLALTYLGLHGCLAIDGEPVGVADVRATGRRYRTCSQVEALGAVTERLAPSRAVDEFVVEMVRRPEVRLQHTTRLKATALSPDFPHFEILEP